MTSPSGLPPVGQAAASQATGMVVHGREPTGTDVMANGSAVASPASVGATLVNAGLARLEAGSALADAGPARSGASAARTGAMPALAGERATTKDATTQDERPAASIKDERSAASGQGAEPAAGPRPYQAGPKWAWFLPSAITLAVSLWDITKPSFWRDEAATIAAVRRPFRDLITMLGNVDAVHSVYYMFMWPLVHTFGPSELVLRLPSALAISAAAAGVAAIGRRLISPWAGLAAGVLFAFLPVVSRYGQEGRSYAAVILMAVIASYFLVRVLDTGPSRALAGSSSVRPVAAWGRRSRSGSPVPLRWPTPLESAAEPESAVPGAPVLAEAGMGADARGSAAYRQRRRWLVAYGASLAVLGMVNIFGLLLIGGHAVTVALQYRRHAGDHAMRRLAVGWLIAVIAGVIVTSPLLVFGWMEHSQIAWLAVNTPKLTTLLQLTGSFPETVAIVVVIGVVIVVAIEATKEWRRSHLPRLLAELALPWLFVPPIALLAASLISPVYTSRYILICVPAIALLGGAAITRLGRIGGPIALVALMVAGVPGTGGQQAVRSAAGHYDDIRGIDQIVAANKKPGDVVLYTNPNAESFGSAYSYGLGTLPNIAQNEAAIPSGTLAGTQLSPTAIKAKLRRVSRVWIVEINKCVSPPQLLQPNGTSLGAALTGLPLHFVRYWHDHGDWLLLYAHGAGMQIVLPAWFCPPTTTPATS